MKQGLKDKAEEAKKEVANIAKQLADLEVKEEELEAAIKGAYALNLVGLNVTVPHKQAVMKYLVEIDKDAAAIGAVNTLVRTEGGYKGYNTDAAGLLRAMKQSDISIKGEDWRRRRCQGGRLPSGKGRG